MDKNSPVIGPIVMVSNLLLGERADGELAPWDGKHPSDSNWPNEDSGWMMDLFTQFIPDFDHDRFTDWLDQVTITRRPELLLQAPLCTAAMTATPKVKTTCIVGDDILYPPAPESDPSTEAKETVPLLSDEEYEAIYQRELFPQSVVPREVVDAAKAVPLVGTDGLKIARPTARKASGARSPRARKPKGALPEAACSHASVLDPKTRLPLTCPCSWTPKSPKSFASKEEYDKYISEWRDKRLYAAKKRGFAI
jgi:hypothetical protein